MYANLMQGGRKWRLALSLHLVLLGAAATENKPNLRLCCRVAQRGTKVDSKAMYPRDRRRWKANNCDNADLWRCQHHDLKSAHSLTIDGRLSNAASSENWTGWAGKPAAEMRRVPIDTLPPGRMFWHKPLDVMPRRPGQPPTWGTLPLELAPWGMWIPVHCGDKDVVDLVDPFLKVSVFAKGRRECACGFNRSQPLKHMPFKPVVREVVHEIAQTRTIFTNAIPPHGHRGILTPPYVTKTCICPLRMKLVLPLKPELAATPSELGPRGFLGVSMTGVPLVSMPWIGWEGWGDDSRLLDGHPGPPPNGYSWHYHAAESLVPPPHAWGRFPSEHTQVGWAIDGFPIYGALPSGSDEDAELDPCNGRFVDGQYRYHVRRIVNYSAPFCDGYVDRGRGLIVATAWKPLLGCFSGRAELVKVKVASEDEVVLQQVL